MGGGQGLEEARWGRGAPIAGLVHGHRGAVGLGDSEGATRFGTAVCRGDGRSAPVPRVEFCQSLRGSGPSKPPLMMRVVV